MNPISNFPLAKIPVLVLGLVLALVACDSTPVEPTGAVGPTPKTYPPPPGSWSVTLTVTQVTGTFCVSLAPLGSSATALYTIQGEGTSTMTFVGPDIEWNTYTVAVQGLSFQSAPITLPQTAFCAPFVESIQFAGTFAPDHNSFSATERNTFTLSTGEVVSRVWTWTGKRN